MSDNKYLDYIIEREDPDEMRRRARKKKRRRSRAVAWVALVLVVALVFAGVFLGAKFLTKKGVSLDISKLFKHGETEATVASIEETHDVSIEEEEVVIAPPEEIEEIPSPEEEYDAWLEEQIGALSLEDKVMGLFIVRPEQITGVDIVVQAGDGTREALEKYHVGGIVYSDSNIISEEQFKTMTGNTVEYSQYPLFLILNEESGNTVLASKLGLEDTLSAARIGETLDPHEAYNQHKVIADYLADYGINFNIGISAGLSAEEKPGDEELFMADRLFGSDAGVVSRMIQEAMNPYRENGISCAVGFFPGQGDLTGDPGNSVMESTISYETFMAAEAGLFKEAAGYGAAAIVVGHEYNSELTGDPVPTSLSKRIYTDILRSELGLKETVLITDALDKPVIKDYYTSGEVCVKALKAGADMLMCPENIDEGIESVLEAVRGNVISEERINDALKRVWKVKFWEEYSAEHPIGENEE